MHAERLTALKLAGVLLAMGGVALALTGDLAAAPPGAWRGDLVMLAAAGCGAGYNVASRPLLRRYPPLTVITRAMLAGAIVLGLAVAGLGQPMRLASLSGPGWAAVAYLGVIGAALTFWLSTWARAHDADAGGGDGRDQPGGRDGPGVLGPGRGSDPAPAAGPGRRTRRNPAHCLAVAARGSRRPRAGLSNRSRAPPRPARPAPPPATAR